jgi:6-phosphogluconolactonase/glucosamine-6-phosphate isomerase/deaminase
MGIVIQPNADAAAAMAARIFANLIISKPDAVLGLATGSTRLPLYRKLIAGGSTGPESRLSTWTNTSASGRTTPSPIAPSCAKTFSGM